VVHTGKLWVKILNVGGYLGSRSSSFLNIYDFLIILSVVKITVSVVSSKLYRYVIGW